MTKAELAWWAWNNLGNQDCGDIQRDDGRGGDGPPGLALTGEAMYRVFGLMKLLHDFKLEDLTAEVLLALFRAAPCNITAPNPMAGVAIDLYRCLSMDWNHWPGATTWMHVRFPQ